MARRPRCLILGIGHDLSAKRRRVRRAAFFFAGRVGALPADNADRIPIGPGVIEPRLKGQAQLLASLAQAGARLDHSNLDLSHNDAPQATVSVPFDQDGAPILALTASHMCRLRQAASC